VVGNCCHFELEADLLRCLIIVLESWTVCYHQSDQSPLVVGPPGCRPCRMEREVAWYGTRSRPRKGAVPARLDDVIDGTGASTLGRRVTWHLYRLLGYFLTGSVGEHPVKNS